MNAMKSQDILDAFREGLEKSDRWRRFLAVLGFDISVGRPGPYLLNNLLQQRGFRRVLNEDSFEPHPHVDYPDEWWRTIAREIAGDENAGVDSVVKALEGTSRGVG